MLPLARRITRAADFRTIYRYGRRVGTSKLVVYWRPNGRDVTRFGFSVSKKVGRSVVRNRLRRLLREACRRHLELFKPGFDVVLVARPEIKELDYYGVLSEVLTLSRKARLLVEGEEG